MRSTIIALFAGLALVAGCERSHSKDKPAAKPADKTAGDKAGPGASRPGDKGPGAARPAPTPIPAPDDVAAPPADAEKTASGLASKVLQPGTGKDHPAEQDRVKVHYTGWTTDGKMFDSSVAKGRPATFPLKGVIPGWTEGLQLMVVGEKRRLWVPENLAYQGRPGAPAGMLVFDVELMQIIPGPKPLPAPEDVAAPPADAKKTKSGLAYNILTKGTGDKHPKAEDSVKVHYTGWTTDGKMFDSSVQRGQPATFPLNRVIAGWTEGLQLMVAGDKARFWIPEALAYKGQPGKPAGMLVFDVELMEIHEAPKPIPPPKDVAAPPKDAQKTASGLAYKAIKKGTGGAKPTATSRVEVNYTGWTTDGKMFDSSVQRGQTATFPLNRVIAGWTEGMQLMSAGDTFRFWIPEDLAYKGQPGKPAGMLVFDVELISIK